MGTTINTRYGAIDVTLQDERTAYVRVGSGDRNDSTPADAVLELPRGFAARGHGHFKRIGDYPDGVWCWEPMRHNGFRRATGGDLPPSAQKTLDETIAAALNGVPAADLEAAQAARNLEAMNERLAQMDGLERMRDQLRAQATALELDPGARVVYVEQRLRSGSSQQATAVRKSDGTLLFVDEPRYDRQVSESSMRRYLGEPADWTER